jgi:hypothetical protein
MKKTLLLMLICVTILNLYWCWSDIENNQVIIFNDIEISIWFDYKQMDPSLIENNQVINKILKTYKSSNKNWFDKNMVITYTNNIWNKVDFFTLNRELLKKEIVWYKQDEITTFEIELCNNETTNITLNNFNFSEWLSENWPKYYIKQYSFVNNNKWYIISFATQDKSDNEEFNKYWKTIKCYSSN